MARKSNPRINKQVRDAVADLIDTETSDPRLNFITITDADVTPDHDVATVYYSTLDPSVVSGDPRRSGGDFIPDATEVAAGLAAAGPRLRGLVGRRAGLRVSPDLRFVPDPVVAQAARIDDLLRTIDTTPGVTPDGAASDASDGVDGNDGGTETAAEDEA